MRRASRPAVPSWARSRAAHRGHDAEPMIATPLIAPRVGGGRPRARRSASTSAHGTGPDETMSAMASAPPELLMAAQGPQASTSTVDRSASAAGPDGARRASRKGRERRRVQHSFGFVEGPRVGLEIGDHRAERDLGSELDRVAVDQSNRRKRDRADALPAGQPGCWCDTRPAAPAPQASGCRPGRRCG